MVVTCRDSRRSPLSRSISSFFGVAGDASWLPHLASMGSSPHQRAARASIDFVQHDQKWT